MRNEAEDSVERYKGLVNLKTTEMKQEEAKCQQLKETLKVMEAEMKDKRTRMVEVESHAKIT